MPNVIDVETRNESSNKLNNFSIDGSRENITDRLVSDLLNNFQIASETKPRVIIKNTDDVQRKLRKLILDGCDAFQVVSDFDRTLSKYSHNGRVTPTCHGIFEMDPELTEETKRKLKQLRSIYFPIEVDSTMKDEEKIPYMVKWWDETHEVIVNCGIHRSTLEKTVRDCSLVLRENVPQFFNLLSTHCIPVLIFSAGLGDVIDLFLRFSKLNHDNMRIVSNFMMFDTEEKLIGFTSPVIHVFNKTASSIPAASIPKRPNILLLGDSTGDVHMADGATIDDPTGVMGTVLRVGFLNDSIDKNLEKYKEIYDLVLIGDETFDIPIQIIQSILLRQC